MKRPWASSATPTEEWDRVDRRVDETRERLRVLINELQATLDRIEDKERRGLPGA